LDTSFTGTRQTGRRIQGLSALPGRARRAGLGKMPPDEVILAAARGLDNMH
jgi:hypothetical protein